MWLQTILFVLASVLYGPQAQAVETTGPSFSDVPSSHFAFEAIEDLKKRGIIMGYRDGTYRPESTVNRAEAVKIIVAPFVNPQQLGQFQSTPYDDVPRDTWYFAYVEAARQSLKIIDGPPKAAAFQPDRPVRKAEFIKMILLAYRADPNSFSEIRLPLTPDVANPDEWYYAYLRYALSSSMTAAGGDGHLHPAKELTRGEVAVLLHRFLLYREGRRTQELLSQAEKELTIVLSALDKNDIVKAEHASARALLAARGAHVSASDEPVVKGAVKITEGYRALVRAYRAGVTGDLDSVVKLSGDAWYLAAKAKEFDPTLTDAAGKLQKSAQSIADSARGLKAKG